MFKQATLPRSICGSGGCSGCPFSCTEESDIISNYGCLPDNNELIELVKTRNVNWSCHAEQNVICGGLVAALKENNIPFDREAPLVDFTEYSHLGMDVAIALAQVRNGLNPIEEEYKNNKYAEKRKEYFDYSKCKFD